MAIQKIVAEPLADPEAVVREGLVFARLAAAQGDVADEGRVISLLAFHAELLTGEERAVVLGEGMARYSRLADRGDELPGSQFEDMVAATEPAIVSAAVQFQELLKEGEAVA
ncbi:hypothetical protein HHL27_17435 [Novosphingobium sp. TW-4]|uniref:Uncharacterized protein n=2 Tax=Novosphingobium olei TaxID=2728851 RepID=A0A7Y0BRY3_9SPHN|nr:hypothetical protein [Novosphingobium olei]